MDLVREEEGIETELAGMWAKRSQLTSGEGTNEPCRLTGVTRGHRRELAVTDSAEISCPRWLPGVVVSTTFFAVLYSLVVGQESHRRSI